MSDKSGSAAPCSLQRTPSASHSQDLHNPDFSSQSLECQESRLGNSSLAQSTQTSRRLDCANEPKRESNICSAESIPESNAQSPQAQKPTPDTIDLNFIDYCLFITFFPQLIAGPIVHHREMMPQFHAMQNNSSLDSSKLDSHAKADSACLSRAPRSEKSGNKQAEVPAPDFLRSGWREMRKPESGFLKIQSFKDSRRQDFGVLKSKLDSSDSKILDEKCGLQGKAQGSYLSGNDRSGFSPLPHLSLKAESLQAQKPTPLFINWEFIAKGLFIFSIGLFKKVCIADSFAKWVDLGFGVVEKGAMLNLLESWATALSYTFQLYFDFSGYCDMAIGLGLLFGIVLPLNFNSPYKALNIAEFWRNWHMTLGRFLKEYVYIPLGGNRNTRRVVSLAKNGDHCDSSAVITTQGNSLDSSCETPFLSQRYCRERLDCANEPKRESKICSAESILESSAQSSQDSSDSKICDEKCGLQGKSQGSYLSGNDRSDFSQLPHLSRKAELPLAKILTLRNLFIVAFLSGIWHGAGWGFVLWGSLHGLAMVIHRIYCFMLDSVKQSNQRGQEFVKALRESKLYLLLCWFITFNFVNIAWVFFRAQNIQGAWLLIKGMFFGELVLPKALESKLGSMIHLPFGQWLNAIKGDFTTAIWILGAFVLCLVCRNSAQITDNLQTRFYYTTWAASMLAIALLYNFGSSYTPFLYFNF